MCAIFAVFGPNGEIKLPTCTCKRIRSIRELAFIQSKHQRHRGPDYTGVVDWSADEGVIFLHERLAVVCPETGDQPLISEDGDILLTANGEIYNYLELSAECAKQRGKYVPRSDCDVIIAMYQQHGDELVHHLTGMFGFVLYDKIGKRLVAARDPVGIIPLYKGLDDQGNLWFASEMKCLVGVCDTVEVFQPGTLLTVDAGVTKETQYFQPTWLQEIPTGKADLTILRQQLVNAVRSHLQADAPFGSLLSGGVDSSLISAIATKILRERNSKYRLRTYSVGLENAPDFKYSRMVAEYINSDHREIIFRVEDGIDYIRDAIYHTESYDITTIRCSIPMIMMARAIKSEGLKMILSGEGADEIFGGYLYFHQAPNAHDFHHELINRVQSLHQFDCLRANKATMAYGLELRVPFLDTEFLNHSMSIRPEDKMPGVKNQFGQENGQRVPRIEKHILRAAFAKDYLPDEVLWRQKEQFSDGVGYSWIDTIRQHAAAQITDEEFARASEVYPFNTPATKEAFYYRAVFAEMFPGDSMATTAAKWLPRSDWGCQQDPSGRAQNVHTAAYKK